MPMKRLSLVSCALVNVLLAANLWAQEPPPDGTWTADAVIERSKTYSISDLGDAQGIAVHDGKIYVCGDVNTAKPRIGAIREYDLEMKPTGRIVWLRKDGKPLILHPTGLTWDKQFGTFLGDTVNKKATIYQLDWERAWRDGTLDNAVLAVIHDDAAVNGCRPMFVRLDGRTLLATSDYGNVRPEIRLCDPERLLSAGRTSAPGVIVHRVLCGPWNQNMHWNDSTGVLTLVQNVIEGRGWRLDRINLAKAVADGRVEGPSARVATVTFTPHDELEGYWPLDREREMLITSSPKDNLVIGVVRPVEPRQSPAGTP
jgi:hypothetical protein